VKVETLKAKFLGGPQRAVAVHVSAEVLPGRDPRVAIERFLDALGPIDHLADTLSTVRAEPVEARRPRPSTSSGRTDGVAMLTGS
jgi:hypothetical protein